MITSLRRLLPAFCIAAIPCALAAQRVPGSGYTMTMTTDSGGRPSTMSIQLETMGSKFRNAMKSDIVAAAPMDMIMIFDSTAGTITNVMLSQSMAMIMPQSLMKMASQQSPYTMELGENPKVGMVDLGAGERMLGFATRHYSQTLDFTMKIKIGGETCTKPTHEVAELWITNDIRLPDLSATLTKFMGVAAPTGPVGLQLDSLRNKVAKGAMLRRVSTASSLGATGDSLRVTTKMEITAISADSVDALDFEVPAGLRVMDMRETMANMDPGAMQQAMFAAQLNAADKLKQTLCGGAYTRKP